MKSFTTQKAIKARTDYVLQVGYCDLQNLLCCVSPSYYNAGTYGWNCDYYFPGLVDGKHGCICTGYRPHGKRVPYDLVRKYEYLASATLRNTHDYDATREKLNQLILDFIREALA